MMKMTEEIIIDGGRMAGITTLKNEIKRLEQERDELKKACEKCKLFDIEKTNRDLLERIEKLEQENKELKIKLDVFAFTISNYESALEEIKEVATLDDVNCNISPETMNVSKDVLKIVNEVLNEG